MNFHFAFQAAACCSWARQISSKWSHSNLFALERFASERSPDLHLINGRCISTARFALQVAGWWRRRESAQTVASGLGQVGTSWSVRPSALLAAASRPKPPPASGGVGHSGAGQTRVPELSHRVSSPLITRMGLIHRSPSARVEAKRAQRRPPGLAIEPEERERGRDKRSKWQQRGPSRQVRQLFARPARHFGKGGRRSLSSAGDKSERADSI